MPFVTRTVLGLLTWLAVRAGSKLSTSRRHSRGNGARQHGAAEPRRAAGARPRRSRNRPLTAGALRAMGRRRSASCSYSRQATCGAAGNPAGGFPRPSPDATARASKRDESGEAVGVIAGKHRDVFTLHRRLRSDRDHALIFRSERGAVLGLGAAHLDLGDRRALESLQRDEIGRRQQGDGRFERRWRRRLGGRRRTPTCRAPARQRGRRRPWRGARRRVRPSWSRR